jgi:hypothetical protein
VVAPDGIDRTWSFAQVMATPELRAQVHIAVRWFEDHYTITSDWPDECFINHSFAANGLWHLGFVFALRDLPAGSELTLDYRLLLAPGQEEDFIDTATGEKIIGLPWAESLATSTRALASLLAGTAN